jgi:hypothetical protein
MALPTQAKLVHMYMHASVMHRSFRYSTHTNPTGCNAAGDIYIHTHDPAVYALLESALVAKMIL